MSLLRHLTRYGEPRGEGQADSFQNQENYLSWQLLPELSARALSRWRLRHLTHDGESRREKQADSAQNQEHYLSYQIEATSSEMLSSAASCAASTGSPLS